jgi:rsbT co-antagonist protein RsbR
MANQLMVSGDDGIAIDLGFTDQSIERRRRIVGFGPDDQPRVARVRELVTRHAEEYTMAFFSYLSALDEARDFMRNRELVEMARKLKAEHIMAMVAGQYGMEYAQQRIKLGLLYSKGGLDMRLFLGAFHHLMRAVGATIVKNARNADEGFEDFMSVQKIGFLDISIIVDVIVMERERTIGRQQEAIRELSTPVLQIREQLLMLPIIGTIDTHRARMLTEGLLHAIRANRAKVVVVDVTGVAAVDTKVANHLLQTVAASKLMGANVIVTGMSAEVAQTLVNLGVDLTRLNTIGDLRGGIEEAERILGYDVSKSEHRAGAAARLQ